MSEAFRNETDNMITTVYGDENSNAMVQQQEDSTQQVSEESSRVQYFVDEEIDISDFEIVSPEFFSQVKEPSFTVNVNKIYVNAACVRLLPEVKYVKILVSRRLQQIAIEPSDEMDIKAYRWSREKEGRLYASQRTGDMFVMMICKMMGWDPDCRYNVVGRLIHSHGKSLVVFDLQASKCFPKLKTGGGKAAGKHRNVFPIEKWNGRFGPTYAESKRSLHIDTFDEYTVWTIKEGDPASAKTQGGKEVTTEPESGGNHDQTF